MPTVELPEDGAAARSHGTFFWFTWNLSCKPRITCLDSLHITGPSQSPQAYKLHPATVTETLIAVAGYAGKDSAHVNGDTRFNYIIHTSLCRLPG
jgi:hypothetical protein